MNSPFLELRFPVHGTRLPVDHGWALFAAISRVRPSVHDNPDISLGAIEGGAFDGKQLRLERDSFLPVRVPGDQVREVYPLAGSRLEVMGHKISLGVPVTRMLHPADTLHARIVVITNRLEWLDFEEELRRQLTERGVVADIHPGRRRVLTIRQHRQVGYAVGLSGLSQEMSMTLLSRGVGGRRHMGAGFFRHGELPESAHASLRDLGMEEVSP